MRSDFFLITLPSALTTRQQQLLRQWLTDPRRVPYSEWPILLAAFDLLHSGIVQQGERKITFQTFYRRVVDAPLVLPLIQELIQLGDVAREGYAILAHHTRYVLRAVESAGLNPAPAVAEHVLLACCASWFTSFGKGCIYELTIYADLEAEGIEFWAHDLVREDERYSFHDMELLGRRGDVKGSTYFLHVARSYPLGHAFYITRLYEPVTRRKLDAVLLCSDFWKELNGETTPRTLEEVATAFPEVSRVIVLNVELVVVSYDLWKEKVKQRQAQSQGDIDE